MIDMPAFVPAPDLDFHASYIILSHLCFLIQDDFAPPPLHVPVLPALIGSDTPGSTVRVSVQRGGKVRAPQKQLTRLVAQSCGISHHDMLLALRFRIHFSSQTLYYIFVSCGRWASKSSFAAHLLITKHENMPT
jgi:hypothetical protein